MVKISDLLNNVKHWRDRAEEARMHACFFFGPPRFSGGLDVLAASFACRRDAVGSNSANGILTASRC
jgi:hypothetical protein